MMDRENLRSIVMVGRPGVPAGRDLKAFTGSRRLQSCPTQQTLQCWKGAISPMQGRRLFSFEKIRRHRDETARPMRQIL